MNGDRFERDLRDVLSAIAGEEAPMSLRARLSRISDEAPISRRLWFAQPMRLSLVLAAAVAVFALAILLIPGSEVGPVASGSPAEPSPSTDASQTAAPSASATTEPTSTPEPDPAWTGIAWSAGVEPFAPNTSWITDIQPWGDRYIAVGGTFAADGAGLGTVFTSPDGLHWSITYQAELPDGWALAHLLRLNGSLLAISDQRGVACEADLPCPPEGFDVAPRLWSSTDGSTWSQVDSPSWRAALGDDVPFDYAASDEGVVAVLYSGSVLHSADGLAWARLALPATETAIPLDVTAFHGGFVVVGRDGDPDPHSQVTDTPPAPGTGQPVAWVSANGVDWTAARVEGDAVPGGELREVAAGADGLFAAGIAGAQTLQAQPVTHGWASTDGMTWSIVGRIGEELPRFGGELLAEGFLVGDGEAMLILGPDSIDSPSLAVSVSTDGRTWERLSFSGEEMPLIVGVWNEPPDGVVHLTRAWLATPRGVIVSGFGGSQRYWFGTATLSVTID